MPKIVTEPKSRLSEHRPPRFGAIDRQKGLLMMRLSDQTRRWAAPVALLAAFGLGACASSAPPPTHEIASARSAISRAQLEGAGQLAPTPLQSARDKLARAQTSDDTADARRLAEQAEVDGNLAAASARAARAETTATDLAAAHANLQQGQPLLSR
jgi:hypothetical protein